MKWNRLFLILVSLALVSTVYCSTLAGYADEYNGSDSALVARWNFGARGEEDREGEFYNKGFTFDLFDGQSIEPMDYGMKSFFFTGGGSDVAIAYDVEMNVRDLLWLATGTVAQTAGVDLYAPFIFKIAVEINDGAEDDPPIVFSPVPDAPRGDNDSGWFRPKDIVGLDEEGFYSVSENVAVDEEGFFSIFDHTEGLPYFSKGSCAEVMVTVYWQWNTSFYINEGTGIPSASGVVPDASGAGETNGGYLPYYWRAYDAYYGVGGLNDQWLEASQAVVAYLNEHGYLLDGTPGGDSGDEGSGEEQGEGEEPDPEEQGEGGGTPPEGGSQEDDYFDYDYYYQLVDEENAAIEACNTSLMTAYDDYDTLAVNALVAREDPVKVVFRIKGEQSNPE